MFDKNLLEKISHESDAPEWIAYHNYDMVELKLKHYKRLWKVDHYYSHDEVEMTLHIVLKPDLGRYKSQKELYEKEYQKKIKEWLFTKEIEKEHQNNLRELDQRLEKYKQEHPVIHSVGTVQEMKDISKWVRFTIAVPDELAMEINKMKSRVESYLLGLEMRSDFTKRSKSDV